MRLNLLLLPIALFEKRSSTNLKRWNKLGHCAADLQKGAYVEVEGELRYREFTPAESDRSVRIAEIYGGSILLLDRSDRQPASEAAESESVEELTD